MAEFLGAMANLGFSIPIVLLLCLIYIIIVNPEKVYIWAGKISELLSSISSYFERNAVANNIRGSILALSKDLNSEIKEIAPYDLKIEWVKQTKRESFIQDNQIVVRMRHHKHQSKNIVVALQSFVEKGVMPRAKKYLDDKVAKTTDLAIVRKVILSKFDDSLDYFDGEILDPILKEDDELRQMFAKIHCLDESGVLTQVVLREFIVLGKKLHPNPPDDVIREQTKEFIQYLYSITTKEIGQFIPLTFNQGNIKVGVVIIARSDLFDRVGLEPHLDRIKSNLNSGIDTIYIISPTTYITAIREMLKKLESNPKVKTIKEFNYYYMRDRQKIQSYCAAIYTEPSILDSAS